MNIPYRSLGLSKMCLLRGFVVLIVYKLNAVTTAVYIACHIVIQISDLLA